ncbi:hypothetical protein AMECASPLE_030378 [Ameca splendens]|uniref:Uncharacterized protein n=1 Tax=Ameca splendens TaxID=208324 RepID=A0ABV0Z3W2_9TELE
MVAAAVCYGSCFSSASTKNLVRVNWKMDGATYMAILAEDLQNNSSIGGDSPSSRTTNLNMQTFKAYLFVGIVQLKSRPKCYEETVAEHEVCCSRMAFIQSD